MVKSKKNKSTGGSKQVIETSLKNKTLDLSSYIKGKDLSTKIKSKTHLQTRRISRGWRAPQHGPKCTRRLCSATTWAN